MIKTGINLCDDNSLLLVRMLLRHPDVELQWISRHCDDRSQELLDSLCGEIPADISAEPDFDNLDLYIGQSTSALPSLLETHPSLKAIITSGSAPTSDTVLGLAEYNRKVLVRGARVAIMPDVATLLGGLALIPAAKNLMLPAAIDGSLMLPGAGDFGFIPGGMSDDTFATLTEQVLSQLQTSFTGGIHAASMHQGHSSIAAAEFRFECNTPAEQMLRLYQEFYCDHRHMVVTTGQINESMVLGTNKSVISNHVANHRISVGIMFDSRFKGGAGNQLHLLNLLFGLHEKTGF